MILDPTLFPGAPGIGVFTALDFSKHPLSEYTLLDNYGATHLINDIRKLDKGIFIATAPGSTIKSGIQSIPITGHNTRIIKDILNKKGGKTDLVLTNVIVVEDFLINIISEALLVKIRT